MAGSNTGSHGYPDLGSSNVSGGVERSLLRFSPTGERTQIAIDRQYALADLKSLGIEAYTTNQELWVHTWTITGYPGELKVAPGNRSPRDKVRNLPSRVIVEVEKPEVPNSRGEVLVTLLNITSGIWTNNVGAPGEKLNLWAPNGDAWLSVQWAEDGHRSNLDPELIYLEKIIITGSTTPQVVRVKIP